MCLIELECSLVYILLRREVWGEGLSIITLTMVEKHQGLLGKLFR